MSRNTYSRYKIRVPKAVHTGDGTTGQLMHALGWHRLYEVARKVIIIQSSSKALVYVFDPELLFDLAHHMRIKCCFQPDAERVDIVNVVDPARVNGIVQQLLFTVH